MCSRFIVHCPQRGLPVNLQTAKHLELITWLKNFGQLSFKDQNSLAGNGQSLPLFGAMACLALFGVKAVEPTTVAAEESLVVSAGVAAEESLVVSAGVAAAEQGQARGSFYIDHCVVLVASCAKDMFESC